MPFFEVMAVPFDFLHDWATTEIVKGLHIRYFLIEIRDLKKCFH